MELPVKRLPSDEAGVIGPEYAIKTKEDGRIFITSKKFIDKLFDIMGYKSLYVIKILEEYAGKTISDIGDLGETSLYINETDDSFFVASNVAVDWCNHVLQRLEDTGFNIVSTLQEDNYFTSYQVIVKSSDDCYFAIYFDLLKEVATCYALQYEDDMTLIGLSYEGDYDMIGGVDTINEMFVCLGAVVDLTSVFNKEIKLSEYEFVELLTTLGYIKKKRKKLVLTELGEDDSTVTSLCEQAIDDLSVHSWIQQHINFSMYTFYDCCKLITARPDLQVKCFKDFFNANQYETSDYFALNF